MEDNKLFSTKETTTFLGVSDRTIQNYRKAEILVPDQFGKNNAVFYSKEQLGAVGKLFFVLRLYFSFAVPKRKITKEKGVRPADEHPVHIVGDHHP